MFHNEVRIFKSVKLNGFVLPAVYALVSKIGLNVIFQNLSRKIKATGFGYMHFMKLFFAISAAKVGTFHCFVCSNANYSWLIKADNSYLVHLTVVDMDLQTGVDCLHDSVKVYEGKCSFTLG